MSMEQQKESVVRQLRAQKAHHEQKIEYWKTKTRDAEVNLAKHMSQLRAIEKKLDRIEGRCIYLTSHAVQRFRERVGPADATEEYIRERILTPDVEHAIRTLGGQGMFPAGDKLHVRVDDYKVITVVNADVPKEHRKGEKGKRKIKHVKWEE